VELPVEMHLPAVREMVGCKACDEIKSYIDADKLCPILKKREEIMIGYKLFKKRKNGTLGPLFINRKLVVPIGEWMQAEAHRTKGFAFRPGWHACAVPVAPHLKMNLANGETRVWCKVELLDVDVEERPKAQGGKWFLAGQLRVIEEVVAS